MRKENRTVVYDEELQVEACRFKGIIQPFPNHFHEYYVIGFVEDGERCLSCRNREYRIRRGDILIFNPGDNHACIQTDDGTLDYRSLNISKEVMLDLAQEATGQKSLPGFSGTVIRDDEVICQLQSLHELIMNGSRDFKKEEALLFLTALLIQRYGQAFEECIPECREEIERACEFIEAHYTERIRLDKGKKRSRGGSGKMPVPRGIFAARISKNRRPPGRLPKTGGLLAGPQKRRAF